MDGRAGARAFVISKRFINNNLLRYKNFNS